MWHTRLSEEVWSLTNKGGNANNNGYPSRIPTTTRPDLVAAGTGVQAAGDGVIPFGHQGMECAGWLHLIPFGAGIATNTFSMKVLGWRATKLAIGIPLWIPVELCTIAVTLGTAAGVTGADLTAASLFATTITMTGGPTFITTGAAPICPDWFQISPGSNSIGMVSVSSLGFRFLETIYTTGGVATSCNALWCRG